MTDMPDGSHRAELQGMLALLAAQLAEIAHANEDDSAVPVGTEPPACVLTDSPPPTMDTAATGAAQQQEEEEDSDDMEEVV